MADTVESLGELLRRKREERGDTQKQAAEKMAVIPLTVTRWEAGSVPLLPQSFRLADYLDMSLDELRPYIERLIVTRIDEKHRAERLVYAQE